MADESYRCQRCGDEMDPKFTKSHEAVCMWLSVWGELLDELVPAATYRIGFPCHRCGVADVGNPYEHAAMHRTLAALERSGEDELGCLQDGDFRWCPAEPNLR